MLRKILVALVGALLAVPATALAQDTGTVAGTVVDSTTSETLPGVNVRVQGLNIGAATGAEGQFEVSGVPAGEQVLLASFVGYSDKEVPVEVEAGETTNINIRLAPQAVGLQDVVVTALGEERSQRSVSTSIQQVDGGDLAEVNEGNFISSLEGRVAGVDIRTSSTMGGSSDIKLRGISSLTGNNQPLIVIDGVPIDNSTRQESGFQSQGFGGFDFGNAARNIEPSNIKSVSVLKGTSAAALYGSRGANGVIQITTKDGSAEEGLGVSYTSTVRVSNPYELMDYQNEYGGGAEGNPFTTVQGNTFRLDGSDDQLVADFATDESWGPKMDGRQVRQWYSFDDVNGLQGQTTPWEAHSDNIENYLSGDGTQFSNSIALSQAASGYDYRLSADWKNRESVFPNSSRNNYRFQFNGSTDLGDKVTATATATYNFIDTKGRVSTGYFCQNPTCVPGTNPFAQFNTFGQRQWELGPDSPMRNYLRPSGSSRGWNYLGVRGARQDPPVYNFTDNPYIHRFENVNTDDQQRLFGKAQVAYDFLPNFQATWKITNDYRTERRNARVTKVSQNNSRFRQALIESQEINTELKVDYNRDLTEAVSLESFLAGRIRWETFNYDQRETTQGLAAPGLYNIENSVGRPDVTQNFRQKQVNSLYGEVVLGYNDYAFLTGTLRNDWASTLPKDDNSFLYPSIQGSFIFTDLGPFQEQDILTYGKLRASWAKVGSSADAYQLSPVFPVNTPFEGQPLQQVERGAPNPNLTREITTGFEVGVDLRFFQERLNVNATFYDKSTEDQILQSDISPTSGFNSAAINAGEITNTGVEASLSGTPILTEEFQWDITVNWATNENEVVKLAEGITTFEIGGSPFGPDIVAREGEPYGQFLGSAFTRDDNGKIVYTSGGAPVPQSTPQTLGSFQPDWTGGVSTTLSYKGITVSALVDGQKGGQIWSLSNAFGTFSGLIESTTEGTVRETGLVPDGVVIDDPNAENPLASDNTVPYSEVGGPIPASAFWKSMFPVYGEAFLFDATHLKLREIAVSYRLPRKWLSAVPVQSATVSVTGRNLATLYKETPNIDPSVTLSAGNVQGIEAGQIPPRRTYGFKLNLQF
jgi:TonB-linked SusC/RagA family outer membrane protein